MIFICRLVIGLFGLVGMVGVMMSPLVGRLVDRLIPWYATLVATLALLLLQAINTGAEGIHVAVIVIVCFGLDVGRQMQQISLTTAVFGISEAARARLNAVLILCIFIGQVMGTAVGTKVFISSGWRAAAALSLGWAGFQLIVLSLRGPHVGRYTWFGYEGGLEWRKKVVMEREKQKSAEAEAEAAGAQNRGATAESGNARESTEKQDARETGELVENSDEKRDPSRMV